jgi:hypothetical protein
VVEKVGGFGCGIRGLVGLSVWGMASSATTKAARRAAREAVVAAQADLARRNRANMDDLAVFLSARHRADAVDDWFKDRVAVLKVQADERRAGQLRECGVALRAMKERGESIRDIARMAGIGAKTVRELIRSASATRWRPRSPPAQQRRCSTATTVRTLSRRLRNR